MRVVGVTLQFPSPERNYTLPIRYYRSCFVVSEGDIVVVNTKQGLSLAKVVSPEVDDESLIQIAEDYIVQVVNMSIYNMYTRRDNMLRDLKKRMSERLEELDSFTVFEIISRVDDQMKDLLDEYDKIKFNI